MSYGATTVVIPTRNRASLAKAAIASVLDQRLPDVRILVSDNSTSEEDPQILRTHCEKLDQPIVGYVRPLAPMPMSAHWDWVIHRALDGGASHVLYLTDRMIFKAGELGPLLDIARRFPGRVISYNGDRVDDFTSPVFLQQRPWSGKLLEVPSSHLLNLSSRAVHPACLPGMLNCIVPAVILQDIERRFGTVFASISPDFCFAYRCLAVVDAIFFYDKPLLIQYSIDRSNGLSYARGVASTDSTDFRHQLGTVRMNYAAPVPEFQTITNAVLHEYNVVKQESGSSRFKEIDRFQYLGATQRALAWIEDPSLAREMHALLGAQGWSRAKHARWVLGKVRALLRHNSLGVLRRTVMPFVGGRRLQPIWMWLTRFGIQPPASQWFQFNSTAEALAYAERFPRRRSRFIGHLWHLMDPPRLIGEMRGPRPATPAATTLGSAAPP